MDGSPAPITDLKVDPYKQDAPMLRAMMAGRSTFLCYEPLKLKELADADRPLVFGDDSVRIVNSEFTPNRIDVDIEGGPETSHVFVNQNYADGWRSTIGTAGTESKYKNIAVTVPARAAGRLSIAFFPTGLTAGWVIFGVAVVASLWFMRFREMP